MIIRLLKPLEKAIKSGHPWIFRNALHPFSATPGEVVTVQDRSGRFLCRGLADAGPIGVRVFSTADVPLDAVLLRQRIQKALRLRDAIRPAQTTALRLISGEGDLLPGVIVDSMARMRSSCSTGVLLRMERAYLRGSARRTENAVGLHPFIPYQAASR